VGAVVDVCVDRGAVGVGAGGGFRVAEVEVLIERWREDEMRDWQASSVFLISNS